MWTADSFSSSKSFLHISTKDFHVTKTIKWSSVSTPAPMQSHLLWFAEVQCRKLRRCSTLKTSSIKCEYLLHLLTLASEYLQLTGCPKLKLSVSCIELDNYHAPSKTHGWLDKANRIFSTKRQRNFNLSCLLIMPKWAPFEKWSAIVGMTVAS